MLTLLLLCYLLACTVVAWYGVRAIFHMTRRTPHLRRAAFILLTAGAGCAFIETSLRAPPLLSAAGLAIGVSLLLLVGVRTRR